MALKSNFQQVLLKTLIPTMNTLKDMAVLNIVKTDGKCAPEAKREEKLRLFSSKFYGDLSKQKNGETLDLLQIGGRGWVGGIIKSNEFQVSVGENFKNRGEIKKVPSSRWDPRLQ